MAKAIRAIPHMQPKTMKSSDDPSAMFAVNASLATDTVPAMELALYCTVTARLTVPSLLDRKALLLSLRLSPHLQLTWLPTTPVTWQYELDATVLLLVSTTLHCCWATGQCLTTEAEARPEQVRLK